MHVDAYITIQCSILFLFNKYCYVCCLYLPFISSHFVSYCLLSTLGISFDIPISRFKNSTKKIITTQCAKCWLFLKKCYMYKLTHTN